MHRVFGRWNCNVIVSNSRYIAALGTGVTVFDRANLGYVHHFTGIRCILGGFFLNEDILFVYTGEQRLYFLEITSKSVIWECPRPRKLASSGDMCCCLIPGTENLAVVARGKTSLEEHYFLLIDYRNQTLSIHEIPNVYRVAKSLVWTEGIGLNLLSFQAKGDGDILYKITLIEQHGTAVTLYEWESKCNIKAYSGKHLFAVEPARENPQMFIFQIKHDLSNGSFSVENEYPVSLPVFHVKGSLGHTNHYLPTVAWFDEASGILIVHTLDWVGVYDFKKGLLLSEYKCINVCCAYIIDEMLMIGCAPGLIVEHFRYPSIGTD